MSARAKKLTTPNRGTPARDLSLIRDLGNLLDDLEKTRVANGNRLAATEREHGSALPDFEIIQKQLRVAEHMAELALVRAWRKHPLAPWAKQYRGLGEKSIARLVAIIGEPADRQTVSQLWQYCGVGNPRDIRIPKGATQAEILRRGNMDARKQVWLIATSMLKAGNRDYYDEARASWADRDTSDGHKHNHALRVAGKKFLRDLWVAAHADHLGDDTHSTYVRVGHDLLDTQGTHARAGHPTHDAQPFNARAGHNVLDTQQKNARAGRK